MNYGDLLYSNGFVGTNEIHFDNNRMTRDRINVLKTIDQQFPKNFNRNFEPIISNEVRDIVKNRYQKVKRTALCLDSRDRNCLVYEEPNNYKLVLGDQFNYVASIKLLDINLNNLFITNTKISWQVQSSNSINMYSTKIPCGLYDAKTLSTTLSKYMSMIPTNSNKIQSISVDINPILNEIKIINRCQKSEIVSAQTILDSVEDIYFSLSPIVFPSQNGIYILTRFNFTNMNLPLIPTGLTDVGEFSAELFNYQEFWKNNVSGNEYSFVDTIIITGITYYRYLLIPRVKGEVFTISMTHNLVYSQPISKFVEALIRSDFTLLDAMPLIGEAKETAIDFSNSPIMDLFGWKECELNFEYVLTNKTLNNISKDKCFNVYKDYCCNYVFKIQPYIFLKLTIPSYASDKIAGNLVKSQNLPMIMECKNNCEFKDVSNIFAKINIGLDNTIETNILQFIDAPLERMDEIIITFVDRNGCPVDIKCDHTITLEITEAVDVLKDTLIDTRHGEANITGLRRKY